MKTKKRRRNRVIEIDDKHIINPLAERNEFHFEIQRKYRMLVIEDKRHKKPKHKSHYFD